MDDKAGLKQVKINELEIICDDINNIMKHSSELNNNWNDSVSTEFKKKINHIDTNKKELVNEIKKIENILKSE